MCPSPQPLESIIFNICEEVKMILHYLRETSQTIGFKAGNSLWVCTLQLWSKWGIEDEV